MTSYVFLGPSLPLVDAKVELDAIYCPPAAAGDVYRVACNRPVAIGIIDGFFERVPAVWHKEILWAMSQGIHVFGAASMGALRAAELADFGMVGVGGVFRAYRSGELQDDDEVAVAHASADLGYRALSEPMVSIRSTLRAAVALEVISQETQASLRKIAKALFYPDRSYERIIRAALEAGASETELRALRAWLPRGRVDTKRDDALEMLRSIRVASESPLPPKAVSYHFEHTHTWETLQRRQRQTRGAAGSLDEELIFDELRLRGTFMAARQAALGRLLALAEARQSGKEFSQEALHATAEELRRELNLLEVERFRGWLADNDVPLHELENFLRDEARFRWVMDVLEDASLTCLADHLRASGEFTALRSRALEKNQILASRGIDPAHLSATPAPAEAELWTWYFEHWLRQSSSPSDVAQYASRTGFRDLAAFRGAVLREYLSHLPR